ncbi:MAG TPA: hypothetical protein VFV07_03535 [Rhizomicrobium sp.]|nr:hypothetical protein [Rhizomicrobium sp.]
MTIADGLDELRHAMPAAVDLIVQTAKWVHPDTFRALPVWYPETARGQPIYDASWSRQYVNTRQESGVTQHKVEPNIRAGKALARALGTSKRPNWTVCHIWGVDDAKFQKPNRVVQDPRYYSCVGNMVWLPTPLKGFTDCVPEIRTMLRTCAFYLYNWSCEHPDVAAASAEIRQGKIDEGNPSAWPTAERRGLPPGVVLLNTRIQSSIAQRKAAIRKALDTSDMPYYPYDQVRSVIAFWGIAI